MTKSQADRLAEALRERFGPRVEVEQVGPDGRYRFAVVSEGFEAMSQLQRQDAAWAVVDATLPRETALDVSLILTFAPQDLISA